MAESNHVRILNKGVTVWNDWRNANPEEQPDLRRADLRKADLRRANLFRADLCNANLDWSDLRESNLSESNLSRVGLRGADLTMANLDRTNLFKAILPGAWLLNAKLHEAILCEANLHQAHLNHASLRGSGLQLANLSKADLRNANISRVDLFRTNLNKANLCQANLSESSLREADLSEADLSEARLMGTDLRGANLHRAILHGAWLIGAQLIEADLTNAELSNCQVYGVSAWNINLTDADQKDLVITPHGEPVITVDNMEVAQFIYLLLNNEKLRSVIDTMGKKVVLILGRFTAERKPVLDGLREKLRDLDYLPVLFDFDKPGSKNITETVSILANLSRFVLADITDAKSIPQELQRIIPNNPSLPVQPLILSSQYEYGMFKDFLDYDWVLLPYRYETAEHLLISLDEVINPAIEKAKTIQQRRKMIEQQLAIDVKSLA
jgi:uncharacterized protein YjbI with pentapeptide repeats